MSKVFKGVVNPAIKVEAAEDKYVITLRVDQFSFERDFSTRDEFKFHIVSSLFRHIFDSLDVSELRQEDVYVLLEVPKKSFSKEAVLTCENNFGLYFELSDAALTPGQEITKYAPTVKVKE
jgi:hypothetical protein